ncbi:hypothetical protein PTKIN_Ptkin13bG0201400 [Pterospermum kingtungense]
MPFAKCNVDAAFFEHEQRTGYALPWVQSIGYPQAFFEYDAKYVIDALGSSTQDSSEFGMLVADCRSLPAEEEGFLVTFVMRQANEMAHALARLFHCGDE